MIKDNEIDSIVEKLRSIKLARERMHETGKMLKELQRDSFVVSSCRAETNENKHNPVAASVAEIEQLEQELLKATKVFAERWTVGLRMINSIVITRKSGSIDTFKSEQCQRVLERRYILGQKWETIASEMGYSWCQVMRVHRHALRALKGWKKR